MKAAKCDDWHWMQYALANAKKAQQQGEVPVGAVVVQQGAVIGEGFNRPIMLQDPTAHAEVIALREAAKTAQNYRLPQTTLYVTLEPCAMCVGAMIQARIQRLVFGAYDLRAGAISSVFRLLDDPRINHRFSWHGGVDESVCSNMLKDFFRARRC